MNGGSVACGGVNGGRVVGGGSVVVVVVVVVVEVVVVVGDGTLGVLVGTSSPPVVPAGRTIQPGPDRFTRMNWSMMVTDCWTTMTVRGIPPGPRGAAVADGSGQRPGRGERVAAPTLDAGHAVAVDHHGGARLQHGLEAGGSAVAIAVVGDAGVDAEHHRGELIDIGRDL